MSTWITYNKPFCARVYSYTEINKFIDEHAEYAALEKEVSKLGNTYTRARSNCTYIRSHLILKPLHHDFVRRLLNMSPDALFSPDTYEEDIRLQEYTEYWKKLEEVSTKYDAMKMTLARKNTELAMEFNKAMSKGTFVGDGLCKVGTLFKCGDKEYLVGHGSVFKLTCADIVTEYKSIYP